MHRMILLAALAFGCGGAPEGPRPPAPSRSGDAIADLCPDDAIALVVLRSADALATFAPDPLPRLARLLGIDRDRIDRTRPLAIAVSGPSLTLIARAPGLEAVAGGASGEYLAFSTPGSGAPGGSPLAEARPVADLVARVDMKQVNALYRPMIEGLLGMAIQGGAGGREQVLALARRLLDEGESLEAVVRLDARGVDADVRLGMEGDAVAGAKDLASLCADLPREFPLVIGASRPVGEFLVSLLPEERLRVPLLALAGHLKGGFVVAGDRERYFLAGAAPDAGALEEALDTGPLEGVIGVAPGSLRVASREGRLLLSCGVDGNDGGEAAKAAARALDDGPGELCAFVRAGDAIATLRADGRNWRLHLRGDPAALRTALRGGG